MSTINPVSFQGKITVTTYNHLCKSGEDSFITHETTKIQDVLIRSVVKNFVKKEKITILKDNTAKILHEIFEKTIGKKVKNTNAKKVLYFDDNSVMFADKDAKIIDGVKIELDF